MEGGWTSFQSSEIAVTVRRADRKPESSAAPEGCTSTFWMRAPVVLRAFEPLPLLLAAQQEKEQHCQSSKVGWKEFNNMAVCEGGWTFLLLTETAATMKRAERNPAFTATPPAATSWMRAPVVTETICLSYSSSAVSSIAETQLRISPPPSPPWSLSYHLKLPMYHLVDCIVLTATPTSAAGTLTGSANVPATPKQSSIAR